MLGGPSAGCPSCSTAGAASSAAVVNGKVYFAGGNLGIPSDYFWIFLLIIIIVGWHVVFQIYKKAGKVQGF